MDIWRRTCALSAVAVGVAVLSACASNVETSPSLVEASASPLFADTPLPPMPQLDPDRVEAGAVIYDQYCAACHQSDLSGDRDWKKPNTDGSLRSPPHDSSGHTWHHSDQLLLALIRDGSGLEESPMPAYGETLTDHEIASVVEFFKSTWGVEERSFQWQVTWSEQQRTGE